MRDGIIFCGAIAQPGTPARGGVESGNRRLVTLLSTIGHRVTELPYRQNGSTAWQKLASYAVGFSTIIVRLAVLRRQHQIFHIAPLTRVFLPAECVVILAAKSAGLRVVTHLRAGSQVADYKSRTNIYRAFYRAMIALSDAVACQGRVYEEFVRGLSPAKPCYFLPNFLFAEEMPPRLAQRKTRAPRLAYVGLVSADKGCVGAIRVLQELRRTIPDATLTLIGKITPGFEALLDDEDQSNVTFTGPLRLSDLGTILDESHYFIFLTQWRGEGHSNALTEAMGRGCVPVATRHGFNESIVGDAGFVVADADDTSHIAGLIGGHWASDAWERDSVRTAQRVQQHFSDAAVRPIAEQIYGQAHSRRNLPARIDAATS